MLAEPTSWRSSSTDTSGSSTPRHGVDTLVRNGLSSPRGGGASAASPTCAAPSDAITSAQKRCGSASSRPSGTHATGPGGLPAAIHWREQLGLARSGRGRDERERALHAPVEELHEARANDRALRRGRHDPPGGQRGCELFGSRRRRSPFQGRAPHESQSGRLPSHNARNAPGVSVHEVRPARPRKPAPPPYPATPARAAARPRARRCPASPPRPARGPGGAGPRPRAPPRRTRPPPATRSRAWPTPPRARRGGTAREDPRRSLRPGP